MSYGPQFANTNAPAPATGRQGIGGETITAAAHGKYFESSSHGYLFCAGDQGVGVTVQTSITTTGILSLHNPASSQKRLALGRISLAYFSGTWTAGTFYHGFNPVGTTLPTSGTTLTSFCMDIGLNGKPAASGVALSGATVVAATVLRPFCSALPVLASTAVWPTVLVDDLEGAIILEPGAVYQLVAVMGGTGSTPKISVGIEWLEYGPYY